LRNSGNRSDRNSRIGRASSRLVRAPRTRDAAGQGSRPPATSRELELRETPARWQATMFRMRRGSDFIDQATRENLVQPIGSKLRRRSGLTARWRQAVADRRPDVTRSPAGCRPPGGEAQVATSERLTCGRRLYRSLSVARRSDTLEEPLASSAVRGRVFFSGACEQRTRIGVVAAEPTEQEVEEWAEREKKRREAWLAGPSESEKREWRQQQRHRRELSEIYGAGDRSDSEVEREVERRLRLDAHLARVGIFDLLAHWPRRLGAIGALPPRMGAKLIRSGLDVEYDHYTEPASSRRPPPDSSAD